MHIAHASTFIAAAMATSSLLLAQPQAIFAESATVPEETQVDILAEESGSQVKSPEAEQGKANAKANFTHYQTTTKNQTLNIMLHSNC